MDFTQKTMEELREKLQKQLVGNVRWYIEISSRTYIIKIMHPKYPINLEYCLSKNEINKFNNVEEIEQEILHLYKEEIRKFKEEI